MRNLSDAGVAARVLVLGLLLPAAVAACSSNPAQRAEHAHGAEAAGAARPEDHHRPEDGDAAGHRHEGEAGEALSLSLEEIGEETCEHDKPTYECRECRYEVGVVRVPGALRQTTDEDLPGLVLTERVASRPDASGLTFTGEVQWNEGAVVHVRPRVPGVVRSVAVGLGDRVHRGDLLFTLVSVELGKAWSDYERSRTLAKLSRRNLERETSLHERRISSEQDVIEARMVYEQHNTERKAAEQALRVLGVTAEDMASSREEGEGVRDGLLRVRAPRHGTIVEMHAVTGERVEPENEIMVVADLTDLWAWADIYEPDLPYLLEAEKKGAIPAEVSVRAFPDRAFAARIDYIGAEVDPKTRTVKVRATVENPDGLLRPGMFCEIRMERPGQREVPVIPRAALLSNEGTQFVFKHWQGDYFVSRPVKVGRGLGDYVEILEGLVPGEQIVTRGAFLLKSDVLREKMGAGCAD